MPAEVLSDPLALNLSLPGGVPTVIAIGDLPNLRLAADLTEGLAASVHPHGPLAKLTTVKSFVYTLRRMVRELAADGFTGSAAELTRAVLGAFWLRSHYLVEYRTRTILRAFDTRHQALTEPVRQMVLAFLREYGVVRDKETGTVLRNKAGGSLRTMVSAMQDITDYGELLSADRHRPGSGPGAHDRPAS